MSVSRLTTPIRELTTRVRELTAALSLALCSCTQVDVVATPQPSMQPVDARVADARGPADMPDARMPDARTPEIDAAADAAERDAAPAPMPCPYATASADPNTQPARAIAALTRAMCSCDSITSSDQLTTDGIAGLRGDVGVNGTMSIETSSTLNGSLIIAGGGGLHLGDGVEFGVVDDLSVGGPLEGALATLRVSRDAGVAARIDLQSLYVTGTLTQPAAAERRVTGTSQLGAEQDAAVTVTAPCDCAAAALFDTTEFVRVRAPLAMPLPTDAGVGMTRCAEYALPEGEVSGVQIALDQPAAIYVPGDLHITGDLALDAQAGAEIDLFVAGDVRIDGRLQVGSAPGQGPVRIHVGGGGTVQLSGGGELHGALYAPKAELVLSAPLSVRGALFMRRIAASAALTVHYDRTATGNPAP